MTPGPKTSEFVTLAVGVITSTTSAMASSAVPVQCTAIASVAVMVSAYILSRGWAKSGNGKD